MNTVDHFDEALEGIALSLGAAPDDGWDLIDEKAAVDLLDKLSDANRKAILHIAAVSKSADRELDADFISAVARFHRADLNTVLFAHGWTPAPKTTINAQQTVALRLSQYLILYYEWEISHGAFAN